MSSLPDTATQVVQAYENQPTLSCSKCAAVIALQDELISKAFSGRDGRGYLMHSATNVKLGNKEDRPLLTGVHTVAGIRSCIYKPFHAVEVGCRRHLSWLQREAGLVLSQSIRILAEI
ncbi:hypothetical protein VKT23_001206 [Stygiomarasmius scandens]|uniref:Yippee domain-containing protein n=1 Tax=Marasmiellus scandens TaxID=2682957 RepID=A0ABR1K8C5_9AGAR